ncbi:GIY-YIG nuclease family protein [Streptomyces sp. NPDC059071]|uniref:GIY-YIG nuclease family protein n=1 Tax=unclassified Streptomyces TaxID=2593676 RepID=UPI00365C318B
MTSKHYPGRTALYRLFDREGGLLYVGVTYDIDQRLKQHEQQKYWWPDVSRWEVTWFGSRAEAEAAEVAAIRSERPLHDHSDRAASRTWMLGIPKTERERREVLLTRDAIELDVQQGFFPSKAVLPQMPTLAARYNTSYRVASQALGQLTRSGGCLVAVGTRYLAYEPSTFPHDLARRHGVLYVLALDAFAGTPFTASDLQQRTRYTIGTVGKALERMLSEQRACLVGFRETGRRRARLYEVLPPTDRMPC